MSKLTAQAQNVLDAFGKYPGVTAEHLRNLTTAINGSPVVVDEMNRLVDAGHLKAIAPMVGVTLHASGIYDDQRHADTIRLTLTTLEPDEKTQRFSPHDAMFVMGHELEHGLNYDDRANAYTALDQDVTQKLREPAPRNYTDVVATFIDERRQDEAEGQLAGWNAVVSALHEKRETGGKPMTLERIFDADPLRMQDFIQKSDVKPYTYSLKPNLTIENDFTIAPSPSNVETIGKNFFDKSAQDTALGRDGQSDYANYYGAYAIGRIAQLQNFYDRNVPESTPRIILDMSRLRLSPSLLEKNGIDMGSAQADLMFLDSSHGQSVLRVIGTTGRAPTLVPETADQLLRTMTPAIDPLHEDLRQRLPPETSADRLAQITLAARAVGIKAGQVGETQLQAEAVFVTSNHFGNFAKVDLTTPPPAAQQSLQQLDKLNQQEMQQQAQQHAQRQIAAQSPQPTGPVM